MSSSPNGLWAPACKLTLGKNAQRAYDTPEMMTDDFPGCCCPSLLFPFLSVWAMTSNIIFPLILLTCEEKEIGHVEKGMQQIAMMWLMSLLRLIY